MNKEIRQQLNDLDFPVLTKQDLAFLDDVHSVLENTILNSSSANLPEDVENEVFQQISVIEENLKLIINNLKVGKYAKEKFVEAFPRWKKIRYDCIAKLYEISASINTDRHNCNISKLVGYCASFLGGALTLASAITLIPTLGATTPLLVAGAGLTGAGCSTTVGASIAEVVLLKRKIREAQELIKEDRNVFTNLGDWLNCATEMQKALVEILNMCPYEDITNAIKDFVDRASRIKTRSDRVRAIKNDLERIIKMFDDKNLGLSLMRIATILVVLVVVFQLLKDTRNRFIFDVAVLTFRGISTLGVLLDDIFDIAGLVNAFSKNAALAGNLSKAIARGAISVFGMALDVTGIIFTSIDVSEGSVSPDAVKIAKAAEDLREEADKLERVYNDLC